MSTDRYNPHSEKMSFTIKIQSGVVFSELYCLPFFSLAYIPQVKLEPWQNCVYCISEYPSWRVLLDLGRWCKATGGKPFLLTPFFPPGLDLLDFPLPPHLRSTAPSPSPPSAQWFSELSGINGGAACKSSVGNSVQSPLGERGVTATD